MAFTYLIGWRSLDVWYYGYKTGDTAQLWSTYFTSSSLVKEHRILYGEPDVVRVHKIFIDKQIALAHESKFLQRVGAVRSTRWLNRHDRKTFQAPTKFSEQSIVKRVATAKKNMDPEERSARAKKAWVTKKSRGYQGPNKGRKFSDEARANMSKSHKGKSPSIEHRQKISVSVKRYRQTLQ